jgi:hypothetical protein
MDFDREQKLKELSKNLDLDRNAIKNPEAN